MKKRSELEQYFEEVLSKKNENELNDENEENIYNGMNFLHQLEKEKLEVKGKIAQWKRHFEKKYGRQPSDEEKVKNIPALFQKYSMVNYFFNFIVFLVLICYFLPLFYIIS